jgi:hypothetical protein
LNVPGEQSAQYSDSLSFTISAIDPNDFGESLAFSATGLPTGLNFTDNSNGTAEVSGFVLAAPGTYSIGVTVTDPDGLSDTEIVPIVVSPEDARVTYTGPLLASTGCNDCPTAAIPLRATIQDISAVAGDPAYDPDPGNIINATVTFVDRANANAPLCAANVILLDPADPAVGTATCNWTADIGSNAGGDFIIGTVVDGYYTRDDAVDDVVVSVTKPDAYYVTGNGSLSNQSSKGLYAGDPDKPTVFGITTTHKQKQKPQGEVTFTVYKEGRTYHIKLLKLSSLVVLPDNPTNPPYGYAEMFGVAKVVDLTDPKNPIAVELNATLHITLRDNGDPGTGDLISVDLWSSSGALLFSSNWDGVQTTQQVLDAGNLQVH